MFWTKTLLNFASKTLSNSFFQKTCFRFEFLHEIVPHQFSSPNGLDGAIGGKSVSERSFVHPKKHVFRWNFLMKPAPFLFSWPKWLYKLSAAKLFQTKTLLNFSSKALSNSFFQKTYFRFEFLYKIVPHLFYGPNGLDGAIGGKSVLE